MGLRLRDELCQDGLEAVLCRGQVELDAAVAGGLSADEAPACEFRILVFAVDKATRMHIGAVEQPSESEIFQGIEEPGFYGVQSLLPDRDVEYGEAGSVVMKEQYVVALVGNAVLIGDDMAFGSMLGRPFVGSAVGSPPGDDPVGSAPALIYGFCLQGMAAIDVDVYHGSHDIHPDPDLYDGVAGSAADDHAAVAQDKLLLKIGVFQRRGI